MGLNNMTTKALTVNQLSKILNEAKKNGFGNKHIMVSEDDEGNGYHELFFGLTTDEEDVKEMFSDRFSPMLPYGVTKDNLKDYVLLG